MFLMVVLLANPKKWLASTPSIVILNSGNDKAKNNKNISFFLFLAKFAMFTYLPQFLEHVLTSFYQVLSKKQEQDFFK